MTVFTSGLQAVQSRTVNHDPEPWHDRISPRGTRYAVNPSPRIPWTDLVYAPRPEFAVEDNPILAAYREYPDHSVEAMQTWIEALVDADGGTPEIREILSDSLGVPAGAGWEDAYWDRMIQLHNHAIQVIQRLINLNR